MVRQPKLPAAGRITSITQNLWASTTATGTLTYYTTPLSWTIDHDNRNRLTAFNRAGSTLAYSYDANSNRLSALSSVTADSDIDGLYEATDFTTRTAQSLNIEATSNRLLGFTQVMTTPVANAIDADRNPLTFTHPTGLLVELGCRLADTAAGLVNHYRMKAELTGTGKNEQASSLRRCEDPERWNTLAKQAQLCRCFM